MKDDTVDQMLNGEALKEAKCDHSKCKKWYSLSLST